jgi:outer membrane protein
MINTKMKRILLVLMALMVLPPWASGGDDAASGDVVVITTDDARELALSNNLDVLAGLAALDTAKSRVMSSDNRWTPRVTASYSYTRLAEKPVISVPGEGEDMIEYPMGTLDNYMLGVQFIWPVYSGGEREASVNLSELAVDGLEAQQRILEDVTGVLAQNLCLELRESRGQITAREKSLEYIDGLASTAEAFFEQGLIARNDLLRVQVEQKNTELGLENARNSERIAEDELNAFIGFEFGTPLEIEVLGYEPLFFEIDDLNPFFELALKQRPEMQAMDLQYRMLDEERKMARSGRLPDVSVVLSFERKGDSPMLSATGLSEANTISGSGSSTSRVRSSNNRYISNCSRHTFR